MRKSETMKKSQYPVQVSIVTPVHDAEATLPDTIASIWAQEMEDWELWLVDDGSTDASAEIMARACAADPRIHAIRLPRQSGAAAARNAGIRVARGRHIAFLDADDLWEPQKLATQLPVLAAGAGLVFSAYRRIDASGQPLGLVGVSAEVGYKQALGGNPIGCLTAVYDTEVYGKALMPDIPRRQDYALWLKLLRQRAPAIGLPDCLASYRVRPGSLSSNKLVAAQATWRVLRECENLGLAHASWCFTRYAAGALRTRTARRQG